MTSNLKPWERARLGNPGITSAPLTSSVSTAAPPPASAAAATTQQQQQQQQSQTPNQSSSLSSFGYGSGYGTGATGSSYGYGSSFSSGYGLGYGSGYGSGYGTSTGFSSYGMSPYSSSFGYGASSSFMEPGMGVGGVDFQSGLIGNGLALMNQVMEGFSRFSYLFGASFDAFRNAVTSLFGMYKGISPILGLLKALLKKLYSLLMWACGVESKEKKDLWGSEFALFESSKAPLIIRAGVGALCAIATPALIINVVRFFKRMFFGNSGNNNEENALPPPQQRQQQQQQQPEKGLITIGTEYVASHDFNGNDSTELSFKKGDKIIVLDHNACPGQEVWANAEMGGKKGKVPMNFLAPISGAVGATSPQIPSSSSSSSYSGFKSGYPPQSPMSSSSSSSSSSILK